MTASISTIEFVLERETKNHVLYVQRVAAEGSWIVNKLYVPREAFKGMMPRPTLKFENVP